MNGGGQGWRVHVGSDFLMGGARLSIFRRSGDVVEFVDGFDDRGLPTIVDLDPASSSPAGLLVDFEVLEQIAEHIKPGPAQGEVARLIEALDVERGRVDDVLSIIRREQS